MPNSPRHRKDRKAINFLNLLFFFGMPLIITGCKKSDPPAVTTEHSVSLLDSIGRLFQDVYLWNTDITFPDKNNGSEDDDKIQDYINQVSLSAINQGTGLAFEFDIDNIGSAKYSTFLAKRNTNSTASDFGFAITAIPSLNQYRILYVKQGTQAAEKGLSRADRVTHVNGQELKHVSSENNSFITQALRRESMYINITRTDGKTYSFTLHQKKGISSEILKTEIIELDGQAAGYISIRSFPPLSSIKTELDQAFTVFQQKGIKQLIVDLRYNSGGYVSTSRYLSNLIIPQKFNGAFMYKLLYNETMQNKRQRFLHQFQVYDIFGLPETKNDGSLLTFADYDYSIEANTYNFEKKNGIADLSSVYFIVSGKTASAAELLINNLSPYMNVKLVGERTYGKPVGYFGIDLGDYTIYLSSFLALNSKEEGHYYNGIEVDRVAFDDPTIDFADMNDPAIEAILTLSTGRVMRLSRLLSPSSQKHTFVPHYSLEKTELIGMHAD